ncbi:MAG: fused MFS/spermidine synthase [Rhodopirellula sp.]|nr:fused MFS/spermidine synthase [Rhodopirellula sp.]
MDAQSLPGFGTNQTTARTQILAGVGVCFFLSGFAGLLYETVWLRQFAAIFGTSEAALGAILASYMGGLALGAWLAARYEQHIRRPVLAYGLLELGVAGGALLVPFGLQAADAVRIAICGGQPELPAASGTLEVCLDSALAFLLILVPTACMGATLPLLARHAEGSRNGERSNASAVGLLYGINTLGAVFGTLTTAFFILPAAGLQATVFVGAAVNLLVFGIAFWLQRTATEVVSAESGSEFIKPARNPVRSFELPGVERSSGVVAGWTDKAAVQRFGLRWLPAMVALASAASFTYEVLWTRLLGQVLGGSLHSFATMLAAFLTGIAIGSCWASRLIAQGRSAVRCFAVAQLVTILATVVAFAGVDLVSLASTWIGAGLAGGFLANVGLCLIVLLPSTIAIGMSLPLAIQISAGRISATSSSTGQLSTEQLSTGQGGHLAETTGRLYAASTLGAIVGSLFAGRLLLPEIGFHGTIAVGVAANLAVVIWSLLLERPVRQSMSSRFFACTMAVPVVVAVLLCTCGPDLILRHLPLNNVAMTSEITYSSIGASSTVMVTRTPGGYRLLTNGLPESEISPRGAVVGAEAGARWLTTLPVLARPDAKSMLIIGFGGGSAVNGVPETIESIDTIELEPKVVEAVRTLSEIRQADPLSDPRLKIVFNDARGALSLTAKKYDAIVSQPSHPWSAGASHLYTREFMQLVRGRLSEDGVFLQWMNSHYVDKELLRSLGATMLDCFENVRVYQPHSGLLLFLASQSPLNVEQQIVETGLPLRRGLPSLRWLGLNTVYDVASTLAAEHDDLQAFCAGALPLTDNRNALATSACQLASKALLADAETVFREFDPLVSRPGKPSLMERLNLPSAKVVRSLALLQMRRRARAVADSIPQSVDRLLADGFLTAYSGQTEDSRRFFQSVLEASPGNRDARFKLIEQELPQLAQGRGTAGLIQPVSTGLSVETAIVQAASAYYRKDWAVLQNLDGALGMAADGDTCQPLALAFRALWRTKVTTPERRRGYGRESLELADRSLAGETTVFAALVRLWAAKQCGDSDAWLESAYFLADVMNSQPYSVTRDMAVSVSTEVLNGVAELQPANSLQRLRAEDVRQLYVEVRDQAFKVE